MSIRWRTISIVTVVLALSTVALHQFISYQQLATFRQIERDDAEKNLNRVRETVVSDLRQLAFVAADYASWDDTYQFAEDLNQKFIDVNLGPLTPLDLDIHTILLLSETGGLLHGIEVDFEDEEAVELSSGLVGAFQPASPLISARSADREVFGFLELGGRLLMAAVAPILKSDDSGMPRGSLVMGRYLDNAKLNELENQTQLDLELLKKGNRGFQELVASVQSGAGRVPNGDESHPQQRKSRLEIVDENAIRGHLLFDDAAGEPVLVVSATLPRTIYKAGTRSLNILLIALIAAGVVLTVTVVVLLDRIVLRRLSRLGGEVAAIGTSGDLGARVNERGKDELAILGRTVNWMLDQLKDSADKLAVEHQRAEGLLLNILPEPVAAELKRSPDAIAESYDQVSILFADLVGFTELAADLDAEQVVGVLNGLFSRFDDLALELGLEKIKTIGDAYMVAAGLPKRSEGHAPTIARMALAMVEATGEFSKENDIQLELRVGINSGVVVAGVIGKSKFIYDLWGDAVNIASRMESTGESGRIQVTQSTYELLKDEFDLVERGMTHIKGRGEMATWFLVGELQTGPQESIGH